MLVVYDKAIRALRKKSRLYKNLTVLITNSLEAVVVVPFFY